MFIKKRSGTAPKAKGMMSAFRTQMRNVTAKPRKKYYER